MKHTLGPWSVTDNFWEVSSVYAPNGDVICECHIDGSVTEDNQHLLEPIKEANARLIAASPDLLGALQKAVDDYGKPGGPWNVPSEPGTWLEMARAAIAKATS